MAQYQAGFSDASRRDKIEVIAGAYCVTPKVKKPWLDFAVWTYTLTRVTGRVGGASWTVNPIHPAPGHITQLTAAQNRFLAAGYHQ